MNNQVEITICLGSSCFSRGNRTSLEIVKEFLEEKNLSDKVFFHGDLCTNNCEDGPIIKIGDQIYKRVNPNTIKSILQKYFDNNPVE